jgi:pyridoxamine 5'-phosphate oxidase
MRISHMPNHVPPLPEPLPDTPLPLVEAWLAEARQATRNATAMTLATVDPDGRPSARMVICRGFDAEAGWLVFYTDRDSPKGHALEAHPRAALVFHGDALERQIRIEGPVTAAPDEDTDR